MFVVDANSVFKHLRLAEDDTVVPDVGNHQSDRLFIIEVSESYIRGVGDMAAF